MPHLQSHLCNQKLDHVFHALLYQFVYLGVELFLQREEKDFFFSYKTWLNILFSSYKCTTNILSIINATNTFIIIFFTVAGEVFTSWPISIAHSLADWSLASTITLNMVHNVGEMRKSVDLLLFVSLDSKAILVLQCEWNIHKHCTINISVRCSQHSGPLSICFFCFF